MLFSLQSQSTQNNAPQSLASCPLSPVVFLPQQPTVQPGHLRIRNPKPPSLSHHLFLAPEKDSHSSVAPKWPSPCMIRAKGRRKKKSGTSQSSLYIFPKAPLQKLHSQQQHGRDQREGVRARAASSGSTNFAWPLGARPAIDCSEQVRLGV